MISFNCSCQDLRFNRVSYTSLLLLLWFLTKMQIYKLCSTTIKHSFIAYLKHFPALLMGNVTSEVCRKLNYKSWDLIVLDKNANFKFVLNNHITQLHSLPLTLPVLLMGNVTSEVCRKLNYKSWNFIVLDKKENFKIVLDNHITQLHSLP